DEPAPDDDVAAVEAERQALAHEDLVADVGVDHRLLVGGARHASGAATEVLAHAGDGVRRHRDLLARARRRHPAMEREERDPEDDDVDERLATETGDQRTGSYQMGDVQARSWTVRATAGSLHDGGRSAGASALH